MSAGDVKLTYVPSADFQFTEGTSGLGGGPPNPFELSVPKEMIKRRIWLGLGSSAGSSTWAWSGFMKFLLGGSPVLQIPVRTSFVSTLMPGTNFSAQFAAMTPNGFHWDPGPGGLDVVPPFDVNLACERIQMVGTLTPDPADVTVWFFGCLSQHPSF